MTFFGSYLSKSTLIFTAKYTGLMLGLNLIWEIAHLPLFTLWDNPDVMSKSFAVVHCTIGDGMIAVITLLIARLAIGGYHWPQGKYWQVATMALILGLIYTVFSEWLNVNVRQSWGYREIMPTIPPFGTGLSPLFQWLVLPLVSFSVLRAKLDHAPPKNPNLTRTAR